MEQYIKAFSYLEEGTTTRTESPTIVESFNSLDLSPYPLKHLVLLGLGRDGLDLHFHPSDLIFPSVLERA